MLNERREWGQTEICFKGICKKLVKVTNELKMSSHMECWRIVINFLSIHCHVITIAIEFCTIWVEESKFMPLFKSGDKNNTDKYRPISILPTLSMLLEKAVHNQFGYKDKQSTQLATTLLIDEICASAEKD